MRIIVVIVVVVVVVVRGDWRSCGARRLAFDVRCKTRDAASDAGRALGRPGSGICGDHMQGGGNHPGQPWGRVIGRSRRGRHAEVPARLSGLGFLGRSWRLECGSHCQQAFRSIGTGS